MIRVLLVDDPTYILRRVQHLLETTPDIEVLASASNGNDDVTKARLHQPDIAIIGISRPLMNGLAATQQIRADCPQARILADVEGSRLAGAVGYILKDDIGNEPLEAIRALYRGKRYFSQKVAKRKDWHIEEDNQD